MSDKKGSIQVMSFNVRLTPVMGMYMKATSAISIVNCQVKGGNRYSAGKSKGDVSVMQFKFGRVASKNRSECNK